jgi:hypothetical protein
MLRFNAYLTLASMSTFPARNEVLHIPSPSRCRRIYALSQLCSMSVRAEACWCRYIVLGRAIPASPLSSTASLSARIWISSTLDAS